MENKVIVILILILVLGTGLRLYDLSHESLWLDETASVYFAAKQVNVFIPELVNSDPNPPLYYVTLHYWINLFGKSAFAIRFLSLLFGIGSLILVYLFCAEQYDKRTGLYTVFLLSVSLIHIEYSQEARMYSLATFFTVLSYYYFVKVIKSASLINKSGYVISSILMIYSHSFGFFIIVSQICHYLYIILLKKKKELQLTTWIILNCIIIAAVAWWLYPASYAILQVTDHFWISQPTVSLLFSTIFSYTRSGIITILLLSFAVISFIEVAARKSAYPKTEPNHIEAADSTTFDKNFAVLLWFIVPLLTSFALSFIISPFFLRRYTLMASVGLYILAAKGMTTIRNKLLETIVILVIVVFSIFSLMDYYSVDQKEQWRETAYFVESKAVRNDLILFNAGFTLPKAYVYYGKRTDLDYLEFPKDASYTSWDDLGELQNVTKSHKNVWLVTSHSRDPENMITGYLHSHYQEMERQQFIGINISLFSKV